jgi:hypothetical protein
VITSLDRPERLSKGSLVCGGVNWLRTELGPRKASEQANFG